MSSEWVFGVNTCYNIRGKEEAGQLSQPLKGVVFTQEVGCNLRKP